MARTSPIRATVTSALGVLLALSFLHGRVTYRTAQAHLETRGPAQTQVAPPSADVLRALFLNFETLAADLTWIGALVYYGDLKVWGAEPKYLTDYAHTIQQLDPYFRPIYEWYETAYLNTHSPPSHEDLEKVNRFLERGMKYFPTDYSLPYSAGLHYMGYSSNRPPKVRIRELNSAIDYLQRAARLEGAPDILPLTILSLQERRRALRAKIEEGEPPSDEGPTDQQIEFLSKMYFVVSSEKIRERIASILENHPLGRRKLTKQRKRYDDRLRRERLARFSYLPVDLWATVTGGEK